MVLQQCGAEVRTADGAAAALEVLRAWRPNALVSDIGMPGEDGYSFIAKVRALSGGFQMHMAKPVEPAELVAVVSTLTSWAGPGHTRSGT